MSQSQKHILVISYSQTGQLNELTQHFLEPLRQQENIVIEVAQIKPIQPYSFPWKFIPFLISFQNRFISNQHRLKSQYYNVKNTI